MGANQFLYFPLALPFFLILVGLFLFAFLLLPLKLMKYAYEQLGVSPTSAQAFRPLSKSKCGLVGK